MSTNQFPNKSPHLGEVRVVTLNLWGRNGAWPDRRAVLIEGFRALQPDLVAFQEVIKNDEYDQTVDLLGPGWSAAYQKGRHSAEGVGISIASRWPLTDVQEVDLHLTPRTGDFPCGALVAEVSAPDSVGPLLFVNHFPNWQLNFAYERELQAVAAARIVEERARQRNQHVLLVGDLDADPEAASIRFWSGRQSLGEMSVCYRDAWESTHPGELGHTFTPDNPLMADWDWPFRRIDYIFVRCGEHGGPTLKVASCQRIFDEPINGVWASDHFGLVADLAVPKHNDCSSLPLRENELALTESEACELPGEASVGTEVLVSLILNYIISSCRLIIVTKNVTNSQISVTFGNDVVFFASAFEH